MHLSVLIAFAAALAVAVAIPGPGIFAVVSCALARGLREALALVAGIILGDLIYFTLAVLGMAALARTMGGFFIVIKLAGAAYLVWLGVRLWRQAPAPLPPGAMPATPPVGLGRSLLGGLVVTLGNPKSIAFYAGLLPTFVDLARLSAAEALAMGGTLVVIVGVIPAGYAWAAAASRRFLARPDRLQLLHRTAGTVMIGTGVTVAIR